MPCRERCKSSGSSAQGSCSKDKARGLGHDLAAPAPQRREGQRWDSSSRQPESRIPPSVGKERVQMRIVSVKRANSHHSDHPNFLPPLAAAPTTGCQGKMGFKSSSAARDSVLQDSTQAELEIPGKSEIGRVPGGTWTKLLLRQGQFQSQSKLLLKASKDGGARVSLHRTAFPCAEPELTAADYDHLS